MSKYDYYMVGFTLAVRIRIHLELLSVMEKFGELASDNMEPDIRGQCRAIKAYYCNPGQSNAAK